MKKADSAVHLLTNDIQGKHILEAACGSADFSIAAARYAGSVACIDLDKSRLKSDLPVNVHCDLMDAASMHYGDDLFDTVVLYNAFYHIGRQWDSIQKECMRVLKPTGKLYIIGSWQLDMAPMQAVFGSQAERHQGFLIVRLEK